MDTALRKHKWFVLLIVVALLVLVGANLGSAQMDEPIELQPYYILMDGEDQVSLVYALDGGWVLADGDSLVYTCGCNGCEVEEIDYFVPSEETPGPYDTPVPTDPPPTDPPPTDPPPTDPPPTDPPPTEEPKEKCNRGPGNDSEGCDPGNSGGKPGSAGEDNE